MLFTNSYADDFFNRVPDYKPAKQKCNKNVYKYFNSYEYRPEYISDNLITIRRCTHNLTPIPSFNEENDYKTFDLTTGKQLVFTDFFITSKEEFIKQVYCKNLAKFLLENGKYDIENSKYDDATDEYITVTYTPERIYEILRLESFSPFVDVALTDNGFVFSFIYKNINDDSFTQIPFIIPFDELLPAIRPKFRPKK